jgi:PAS domain S-box-containing protein
MKKEISDKKSVNGELLQTQTDLENKVKERTAELYKAMALIRESETKFKGLFDAAPDGIVIVDDSGHIVLINEQAKNIFGYNNEDLNGRFHDILLPERFWNQHKHHRHDYFSNPHKRPMGSEIKELLGKRLDGSEFPVEISLSPLKTNEGIWVITIVRDITDRKQVEHELETHRFRLEELAEERTDKLKEKTVELEKATRLKSEFLANMSHELRTPMNSIMGFTERVIKKANHLLPEKQRENLNRVLKNAHHLLGLINSLLDISKIEAGKMEVYPETFNLAALITEVIALMGNIAEDKGINIHTTIHDQDLMLYTDRTKLRQIFINLSGNAVKFTDKGSINVSSELLDKNRAEQDAFFKSGTDYVVITVSDTGHGINPDDMQYVFESFAQAGREKTGGTGLGLTIAKNFTELLQGRIDVSSVKGEGTIFTVIIPVAFDAKSSEFKSDGFIEPDDSVRPVSNTILCIDDDAEVLKLLRGYLSDEGYHVAFALTGDEGIKKAVRLKPFAITLDLLMPHRSGWEILQELKENSITMDIPVILVTVMDEGPMGLQRGALGYVSKPIDSKQLLSVIKRI